MITGVLKGESEKHDDFACFKEISLFIHHIYSQQLAEAFGITEIFVLKREKEGQRGRKRERNKNTMTSPVLK